MIPRLDVSFSALAGALTALGVLAFNAYALGLPVQWAAAPPLLVVVVMAGAAYLYPRHKELFGGVAGAMVVLVEALLTWSAGDPIDSGSISAAISYLVQLVLLVALPRLQVIAHRARRQGEPAVEYTVVERAA